MKAGLVFSRPWSQLPVECVCFMLWKAYLIGHNDFFDFHLDNLQRFMVTSQVFLLCFAVWKSDVLNRMHFRSDSTGICRRDIGWVSYNYDLLETYCDLIQRASSSSMVTRGPWDMNNTITLTLPSLDRNLLYRVRIRRLNSSATSGAGRGSHTELIPELRAVDSSSSSRRYTLSSSLNSVSLPFSTPCPKFRSTSWRHISIAFSRSKKGWE